MSGLRPLLSIAVAAGLIGGGCAAPMLGAAQIDALHTYEYDAPGDTTFSATTNALIDMGYHISVTDVDGGVLRAERRRDPSIAEHALWLTLSTALTLGQGPMLARPDYFAICVLVAAEEDQPRTTVRFEIFKNGRMVDEEKRLDELWVRIDRRLLTMGYAQPEPAPPES